MILGIGLRKHVICTCPRSMALFIEPDEQLSFTVHYSVLLKYSVVAQGVQDQVIAHSSELSYYTFDILHYALFFNFCAHMCAALCSPPLLTSRVRAGKSVLCSHWCKYSAFCATWESDLSIAGGLFLKPLSIDF